MSISTLQDRADGSAATRSMQLSQIRLAPLDIAGRFCYQPPQFAVEAIAEAIWRSPIAV
jgi:hypothetical protein